MARLTRYTQNIFGTNSGFQQMGQFGSVTSPVYTTNIATIQALAAWTTGWYAAVTGQNAAAIQDMNAVHYVLAYQLAYLMQVGVAEWDSGTTYFIGDIVQDGTGVLYVSNANTNLNNAITNNPSFWQLQSLTATTAPVSVTVPSGYSGVIGKTTVPSGVTYTVAGNLNVAQVIQATGTGVVRATGTGVIRAF